MIQFILNEKRIETKLPPGMVLLDFIRYHKCLTGTKIGCREGDCGACTVLVGSLQNNSLSYQSVTSCLMPLGNAQGKHIVTIEGVNLSATGKEIELLNPVQQAMADEGATQCGFCTPGFVMSLTGYCLGNQNPDGIRASVDGNICRCTGYKSIERAAAKIGQLLTERNGLEPASFARAKKIVPDYFKDIRQRLMELREGPNGMPSFDGRSIQFTGGGTDLYVQKPEEMKEASPFFLLGHPKLKGIWKENDQINIGPSSTVTDLQQSEIMQRNFPGLNEYIKLVSSTPIRNMATVGGNFINASPIGDLTIFFLALDAQLVLNNGKTTRELALREFYKGYKQLDRQPGEFIEKIHFKIPGAHTRFHFEKVSKRTNLDIASVNTAICLEVDNNRIRKAGISAGGVGPVPLFLKEASGFLSGKEISEDLLPDLIQLVQSEISPISDARGSAEYKRLLLSQLVKAHFLQLFPQLNVDFILSSS